MGLVILFLFTASLALGSSSYFQHGETTLDYANGPADMKAVKENSSNMVERRSAVLHTDGRPALVKHFYLWTRQTPNNTQEVLDPSDIKSFDNSTFKPRKTFVAIHGFLGSGTEDWILDLKEKLLKFHDCNVIAVDWPAGTKYVDYYSVVRSVKDVAEDVKFLIERLADVKSFNVKDLHIIGHSLGAHLAGFSAKGVPEKYGKYGRITGLDPAGLCYHDVKPGERLDHSDADFVDVIHTNGCYTVWNPWMSCFGINENLGHADFWPNGGEYQPGCNSKRKEEEGEYGCDHMMSYKYFVESVDYGTEDTYFLARNCSSWGSYNAGNCSCGEEAQYMGLHANVRLAGRFFLFTNATPPYAVRDAACAPGSSGSNSIFIIGVSSGSASLVVLIAVVTLVCVLRRKSALSTDDREVAPSATDNEQNRDDALLIVPEDSDNCSDSEDSVCSDDPILGADSGMLGDSREELLGV